MPIPLRVLDENLAELTDLACESPRDTILQLRDFAKAVTKDLYKVWGLAMPVNSDLYTLLTDNSFVNVTDPQIVEWLHFLRIQGNRALHGDPEDNQKIALSTLRTASYLSQYMYIVSGYDHNDVPPFGLLNYSNRSLTPPPVSLNLSGRKLYRATDFAKLDFAQKLGSVTFKSDSAYVYDLPSLCHTGYQDELNELGVVSSHVLSTALIALKELELITSELTSHFSREGESEVIWALKDVREGSIYCEFVAYAVQTVGDEGIKILIESGMYDVVKMSVGAAFISIPKLVFKKLKEKSGLSQEKNLGSNRPYPYSYEQRYEVSSKWKY